MRTSYDVCLEELRAAGLVGPRRVVRARIVNPPGEQFAKSLRADLPGKGSFDRLLDELADTMNRQPADKRPAAAAGTLLVKSITRCRPFTSVMIAERKPISKPRPILARVARKSGIAETISKAFALIHGDNLTAGQRGKLMLTLSDLRNRVDALPEHFSKALSSLDGDPLQAQPTVLRKLKELEDKLDDAAAASQLESATELVDAASALLASGKLSGSDHAALSIQLDSLRQKVERKSHAAR
jgi:hypothetical protein